ncbi:MAG: sialate O-acetylesterase, partial [Muribaculaceae bacterium]|nr:sialate O-acetylesterase [Muribaculaceae bacterium]
MKLYQAAAAATFLCVALGGNAVVRPNSLIGDNMVLQQQTDARLWGTADPGSTVTATTSWNGKSYTGTADADGRWTIAVATPDASYTPYEITLSDGSDDVTLKNILIGEVWLASGQSNMQMPLKGFGGCCMKDGFKEIAGSRAWADKVRFFTVPLTQSYTPVDDVNARWEVPSPETSPEFSGVAWHYAKQLSEVLDVPVGIVSAAYGGARVESWTPRDILETYSDVSLDPKDIEPMTHYLRPLLMYNAMFNPVSPYTYKGIIWYQGCSNVGNHDTYPDRLATMITRWRSDIGLGDIPFYAVEIAPYQFGPVAE